MVVLDVHTLDEHHHQSLTLQSGLELQLRSKLCFENREIKKKQGVEEEKEEVDGSRGPSRQMARSQVTSCARSFYGGAPLTLLLPTRLIVVEPKRKR